MLTAPNQIFTFTKVVFAKLYGLFQNNLRTQVFQMFQICLKYYTKLNITTHGKTKIFPAELNKCQSKFRSNTECSRNCVYSETMSASVLRLEDKSWVFMLC